MDKHKILLPAAIVLACAILGGAFYAVQVNKQKSIEKQQLLKIEEDRRAAEEKTELDKQEFAAKRKNDCLSIYKTESDKWNNVRGWRYDEEYNECHIRFKDPSPKSEAKCDELYPATINDKPTLAFLRENSMCKEGEFENSF